MTLYTRFRKRFVLPIKWWFREQRKMKGMILPTKAEIIQLRKDLKETLAKHERTNAELQASEIRGQITILNWLIDG